MVEKYRKYQQYVNGVLLGEEECVISERNGVFLYNSTTKLSLNRSLPATTNAEVVLDQNWLPLRAIVHARDHEVVTEISVEVDYCDVVMRSNQQEKKSRVPIERTSLLFHFPGAMSLPFLWSLNLQNRSTSKKLYQSVSGVIAAVSLEPDINDKSARNVINYHGGGSVMKCKFDLDHSGALLYCSSLDGARVVKLLN
jgi:hypothetical protein